MRKQLKPGQQLILPTLLAALLSPIVLRPNPLLCVPEFPAAKVSHTGISSPSREDVLPVSCNIPSRDCCHHNETFRFLPNCMNHWFFLFSLLPIKENCGLSAQLAGNNNGGLTHLQLWLYVLEQVPLPHSEMEMTIPNSNFSRIHFLYREKFWFMSHVVTWLTKTCGQKIKLFLGISNLQYYSQLQNFL